jgi:hypothetical protein
MAEQGETLEAALAMLTGSRQESYGSPPATFDKVAELYTLLRGKKLTPLDVAWVMLAIKLVRETYKHKADHMIDLAAYADIINELETLTLDGPSP